MQLHEKYRPTSFGDVCGQVEALKRIEVLRERGLGGRAYWISGKSGTGKTTIARLLAAEIASEFCTFELTAGSITPAGLAELERSLQSYGIGGKRGRAVLIDEAHGLRKDSIRYLLLMLERLPEHVIVVLTTTIEGERQLFEDAIDSGPLVSRCVQLPLRIDAELDFALRARKIAQAENLDGQDISVYCRLVRDCKFNLREVIQRIDAGELKQ